MHVSYNKYNHRFEILKVIYMFNCIKSIQKLLNKFRDKYLEMKIDLKNEKEELKNPLL